MAIKINGVTVISDSQAITTTSTISATGNVTSGNVNTTALTVNNTAITVTGGNLAVGGNTVVTANPTGTSSTTGNVAISGNVTGSNLNTGGTVSATGTVTGGNILTSGYVSATGNIYGGNLLVSAIESVTGTITGGNLATGGTVSATGTVTGGNILTSGYVSATGNVTGSYILGNGSQLTGIDATSIQSGTSNVKVISSGGNVAVSIGGTPNVAVYATTGEYITGLISATGTIIGANITGANLLTGGLVSATGTITGANILTGGLVSATGTITGANITGANLLTGGLVSATGTITGANITGANLLTGGLVSATGTITGANITGANILTGGLVSATANITGGNIVGITAVVAPTIRNTSALTISTSAGNLQLQPTSNIVVNSTYINGVADPLQAQDVATKAYVDNQVSSALTFHPSVLAATTTTTAITTGGTVTYTQPNGVSNGVGAYLQTTGSFNLIDTANVQTVGTRILVKNEANAVWNGIYNWSNATTIVRTTDTDEYGPDSTAQLSLNDYFFTDSGNVNKGAAFVVNAPTGTITFGSSNISFAQFSSSQTYTANTSAGISLNGTVINSKVDGTTTAFDGGGNISVKASAVLTTPNIGAATGTSLSVTGAVTAASTVGGVITGSSISVSGSVTGGAYNGTSVSVSGGVTAASVAGGVITGTSTSVSGGVTAASVAGGVITGTSASVTGTVTAASTVGGVITGSSASVSGTVTAASTVGGVITGSSASVSGTVTGGNLVTAGTLTVNSGAAASAIVNGGANTAGNIGSATGYFNTVYATASKALYADLAENYQADAEYAPGTIVVFGGTAEVTVNAEDADRRVAGVVSTNPSYVMNSGLEGTNVATVALTGRVPCFVVGPVRKGDLMVAAGLGRARAEQEPRVGSVIGKALEDFDGAEGTIEVVVGRF